MLQYGCHDDAGRVTSVTAGVKVYYGFDRLLDFCFAAPESDGGAAGRPAS